MIFYFTDKYKFTANLNWNDEYLKVINKKNSDDLKWGKDWKYFVKKA